MKIAEGQEYTSKERDFTLRITGFTDLKVWYRAHNQYGMDDELRIVSRIGFEKSIASGKYFMSHDPNSTEVKHVNKA